MEGGEERAVRGRPQQHAPPDRVDADGARRYRGLVIPSDDIPAAVEDVTQVADPQLVDRDRRRWVTGVQQHQALAVAVVIVESRIGRRDDTRLRGANG